MGVRIHTQNSHTVTITVILLAHWPLRYDEREPREAAVPRCCALLVWLSLLTLMCGFQGGWVNQHSLSH